MKRTILFPTDFSDNANHALDYAVALAEVLDAEIIVFHAYSIVLVNTELPYTLMEQEMEEVKLSAIKNLQRTIQQIYSKNSDIECSYILKQGFPADHIIDLAKEKDIDFIVMGTKGANKLQALLFGTNAAEVIEKAPCPVFAIPEGILFYGIKNILFSSDYYDSDIQDLQKLSIIAKAFNAEITVLNISDESPEIQQATTDIFIRDLREKVSYPKIEVRQVQSSDVQKGLEGFIKENNFDILVMSTRKRNLFERIVDRSLTKEMAYHSEIPLMAFHHKY